MPIDLPADELSSGGHDRPRRRWPALVAVGALVAGVAVVRVPQALDARAERADRARDESTVRLTGLAVGSGQALDGTTSFAYVLTNDGPLPLRVRLLRARGGGLVGEQERSDLSDPLLPGASLQFNVPVDSADCPGAVSSAVETDVEVVVQTADGTDRTVVVPREVDGRSARSGHPLVEAARLACGRPTPVRAAGISLLRVRVTGDEARGDLVVTPVDRTVVLLRLLPTEGLAWSTSTALPLRVAAGRPVRVPVRARKGDCSRVADIAGQGSIGYEVTIESAPGDSYVEPPQVSFTSPGDQVGSEDLLGDLRDRLCGVVRP